MRLLHSSCDCYNLVEMVISNHFFMLSQFSIFLYVPEGITTVSIFVTPQENVNKHFTDRTQ